ncbi:MAG: alpha-ketoglutarate-dependent dioxygenase AlkB [Hyphomicrobiaceae bacterium]
MDVAGQLRLLRAVHRVLDRAPLFQPRMPRTGRPMSVRMSNCGALGWVSDKDRGYRYEPCHPMTGEPWPPMPRQLIALWRQVAPGAALPEACLINWYGPDSRMGLHVDRDEADFSAPVVSVSLGADAWFRIGNTNRGGVTERLLLRSGDVVLLGGASRLAYHGVDRILPGTSDLVPEGGRINLTLRRVTASQALPTTSTGPLA